MTTTYPPVMRDEDVRDGTDIDQFPDHANVLAVVATYQEKYQAMPWPLLVDVMASLPSIESTLCLTSPSAQIDTVLMDIVTDLRARGLLMLTGSGAVSTPEGNAYICRWNGKFSSRKSEARKNLAELRFEEFRSR